MDSVVGLGAITASVWHGMNAISLWHCSDVLEDQDASRPAFTIVQCGQVPVLLNNEVSTSIKLICRRNHEVLQNVLVDD